MDRNISNIGGLILAGGKSSRMGTDKGLLDFQGKRLVEYAIELLTPLCNEIVISTNQSGYDEFGLPLVSDRFPDCGPLGGLHAGLLATNYDWNLVVSCDTPFLHPDLFEALLLAKDGFDAVIPKHSGGIEPLAGIYQKSLGKILEQKLQAHDYKMQKLLVEINSCFYDAAPLIEKYPKLFFNINRPEELQASGN